MLAKDSSRPSHWNHRGPQMAHSTFLSPHQEDVTDRHCHHPTQGYQSPHAIPTNADISNQRENNISGMSCIRQAIMNTGLQVDTTNIIMAAWRDNTKSKYATYINQWLSFCEQTGVNYLQATPNDGLTFLTQVFNKGRHYSTVAAARSALSAIIPAVNGIPFGALPMVSKFVKGVNNLRPSLPKYTSVWHVNKVLNTFRAMEDNDLLTLKELTLKLATLLCLVLCQRAQTIHSFDVKYIKLDPHGVHIGFPTPLKQTRPGYHPKPIFIPYFVSERKVCPIATLEVYIDKTSIIRGEETRLLLSFIKPHKAITSKTVSRWLKTSLKASGIDVSIFQGHSVRVAGSSNAKQSGVPITNILQLAGWSGEQVFARHYDKPIEVDVPASILQN